MSTPPASPLVEELLADLDRLPSDRSALLRVVRLAGDDGSSAADVAAAAALDPAFAERLLRMANSAYYARLAPVTGIQPAVSLLGLNAVRSLALAAVLAPDDGVPLPPDFWSSAATVAVCSRRAAPHLGADDDEAFTAGLLCDVGQALLFRAAPAEYEQVTAAATGSLAEAERDWCGTSHADISAAALASAGLPEAVCAAVGHHHEGDAVSPLAATLQAAVRLAQAVTEGSLDDATERELERITTGRVSAGEARTLVLEAAGEVAAVLLGLP